MNTIIVSLNYVNFYTGDTLGLLGYGETAWGFTLKQEGEDGSRDSQKGSPEPGCSMSQGRLTTSGGRPGRWQ